MLKYYSTIFFFLLISNIIYSQESKIKLLDTKKIDKYFNLQTFELLIFNNTAGPICLKVSPSFGNKILSSDTIQLLSFNDGSNIVYELQMSEEDHQKGLNDYFYYPLVLNSRTCFATIITLIKDLNNSNKKSWIEFSYLNQSDVNYCDLLKQHMNHIRWDHADNLKFRTRKILLPAE